MKVIVIGTLGETVKKAYELSQLILTSPTPELIVSYTAVERVLEQWPVENPDTIDLHKQNLVLALEKYKLAEDEILEADPKDVQLEYALYNYLRRKEEVRRALSALNDLGKYIGPKMEFDIGEENVKS